MTKRPFVVEMSEVKVRRRLKKEFMDCGTEITNRKRYQMIKQTKWKTEKVGRVKMKTNLKYSDCRRPSCISNIRRH